MTDDKERRRRKTLPMGSNPDSLASTLPGRPQAPESSAPRPESSPDAFPPAVWARQEHVVTSTRTSDSPRMDRGSGQISLSSARISELDARQILSKRFAAAGFAIQQDFPFRASDMLITLDGFDPRLAVGYQYVSHADADVVTDHDTAADLTLRHLASEGHARVLVIHDSDATTPDQLLALADEFLAGLDLTHPG